ncbi:hypothetical protein MB02_05440 [Croceicoccus estronivorus]|uniref:tetratricopeptide repeat protein n=1 Tax=Croceicoccus estronivorus TaxID=1172626 RepID=UPI000836F259|nr:hypothetical protein [Croceicoccus estronivorus]OCC24898.1 hypothetical protein MB02_05440 [Croceicoccus estronivorus]
MSWWPILALAVVAMCVIVLLFRLPRPLWALLGVAFMLGLAGYAWQGHPGMAGVPKRSVAADKTDGAAMVAMRKSMESGGQQSDFLVISDGFARRGDFSNAAGILRGAIRKNPDDSQAWLAMGNALVEQAEGNLTPAALYAFRRAGEANPSDPAPSFFLGVAMLRAGRLIEADELWRESLRKMPENAPQRAKVEQSVAALEALMRKIAGE